MARGGPASQSWGRKAALLLLGAKRSNRPHQSSEHMRALRPHAGKASHVGTGAGAGATINVPLPGGAGDTAMAMAWERVVLPAARRFRPDLVVVSSGVQGPQRRAPCGQSMPASQVSRSHACSRATLYIPSATRTPDSALRTVHLCPPPNNLATVQWAVLLPLLAAHVPQATTRTGATPWPACSSAAAPTTGSPARPGTWRTSCARGAACSFWR